MQSAVDMKPIQQTTEPQMVAMTAPFEQLNAPSESIARRAFEIFQSRGRTDGWDLEDWYRAEAELFHAAHVHLYESDDALGVSAEVPGFAAEELWISLEPSRLTITGKRTTNHKSMRRVLYCDPCADRIFRSMVLPVEVDPKKATAALKNGVLEIALPKSASARAIEVWRYAIVLAVDERRWMEPVLRLFGARA
jgi:HSP20 family molecular chaperone IbpA